MYADQKNLRDLRYLRLTPSLIRAIRDIRGQREPDVSAPPFHQVDRDPSADGPGAITRAHPGSRAMSPPTDPQKQWLTETPLIHRGVRG